MGVGGLQDLTQDGGNQMGLMGEGVTYGRTPRRDVVGPDSSIGTGYLCCQG